MEKRILIAPLNWGLGHAARSIPIIKALQQAGFTPMIASDGMALQFLQKEFTDIQLFKLPSYPINYPVKAKNFKFKMVRSLPGIASAIKAEKKQVEKLVKKYAIDGIISDNRFGVRHTNIPSVIITHQLNLLTGNTTWASSKINQQFIRKFDECWVPDMAGLPNLSGRMGHAKSSNLPVKYIGPLSRLAKKTLPIKYDIMVLLSGPEPQRSFLETKLLTELKGSRKKILFVSGQVEEKQQIRHTGAICVYNYMNTHQLETALNESDLVISRSGYSTIMDLMKLEKKAFFIPTPGQFEQEYLAKRLARKGLIPTCAQNEFTSSKLACISQYSGFQKLASDSRLEDLFCLF